MVWWKTTMAVLSAVGAINWGLAKLNWNVVDKLIGSWSAGTATFVYWIIALCGLYALYTAFAE